MSLRCGFDMLGSMHLSNDKPGNAFWGVLAFLTLFFGFVTAQAIRHNPLHTSREHGISTYKFIQSCKEELHHPDHMQVGLQGQMAPLAQLVAPSLGQGEHLVVHTAARPRDLVSAVHTSAEKKTIAMHFPVEIGAHGNNGHRVIGNAFADCHYNSATGKVEVVLGVG